MKPQNYKKADLSQRVYTLRHIESGEYICLRHVGKEYVACFTEEEEADLLRQELGLLEHVDVSPMSLGDVPFTYYWLDGEMIGRSVLAESSVRHTS
ncbi:MAG: hypothetical protein OHK0029_39800 [Armatimonadaceae bacterium]